MPTEDAAGKQRADVGERLERLRADFHARVAVLKRRQRALLERVIARLDREASEKLKKTL
jgi:hypothetical protein